MHYLGEITANKAVEIYQLFGFLVRYMHSVHPNAPIMCKRADVIYRPGRSQIKASLRIFSKEKKDTSVSIGGVLFKVALNGVMVVRKMLFFWLASY